MLPQCCRDVSEAIDKHHAYCLLRLQNKILCDPLHSEICDESSSNDVQTQLQNLQLDETESYVSNHADKAIK